MFVNRWNVQVGVDDALIDAWHMHPVRGEAMSETVVLITSRVGLLDLRAAIDEAISLAPYPADPLTGEPFGADERARCTASDDREGNDE
jgi:hypothetical protein